jgi:hypothetical protein
MVLRFFKTVFHILIFCYHYSFIQYTQKWLFCTRLRQLHTNLSNMELNSLLGSEDTFLQHRNILMRCKVWQYHVCYLVHVQNCSVTSCVTWVWNWVPRNEGRSRSGHPSDWELQLLYDLACGQWTDGMRSVTYLRVRIPSRVVHSSADGPSVGSQQSKWADWN